MSLIAAVSNVFHNFLNFKGRARRSEYWMFYLFRFLVYVSLSILAVILLGSGAEPELAIIVFATSGIFSLAMILPELAVSCRRLHDIGQSGAYLFLLLLPAVGAILLLIWAFQDGQPWTNQYGPDPKGRNQSPYGAPYAAATPGVSPAAVSSDAPKTPKVYCPYCGAAIDADAAFCTSCGQNLRPVARTETKSASAAEAPRNGFTVPDDLG